MSKADYLIQDQWGQPWLVRPTDPAHELLLRLPSQMRGVAVLPRAVILGRPLFSNHLEAAEERTRRLALYVTADESMAPALLRAVSLVSTLKAAFGGTDAGN